MPTEQWREANVDKMRSYRRKHYRSHRDQYYQRNQEAKAEKREFLDTVKAVPCMDCGKRYPTYCMDLDHRVASNKVADVATLVSNSWKKLRAEVLKCDVVCAICHRIRTYKRRHTAVA